MSDSMEVVHRLEREMADRASAVEKVDIFKAQFNQAIKAFMAADEAVRSLNDHANISSACRCGISGPTASPSPANNATSSREPATDAFPYAR